MHKKSKKERKRVVMIFIAIVGLLSFLVGSVYNDWKQILENRRIERELNNQYSQLLNEQEKLTTEITKLKENDGLMDYARENFMLSSEGDIIINWEDK